MEGWIKLYRKIQISPLYKSLNSKQRDVMIQILLMASHQDNEWEFKGQIYQVRPGQFVTSLESLQEKCATDVSIQNIRTCLLKLEKHGFLTNQSTNKNRLITVIKWDFYQHPSENQQTNQQGANKQLTTINNVENEETLKDMSSPDEVETKFNEWYSTYPKGRSVRKTSFDKFRSLWNKGQINMDELLAGTNAYIQYQKAKGFDICGAQVFLNQERWKDEWVLETPSGGSSNVARIGKAAHHQDPKMTFEEKRDLFARLRESENEGGIA